MPVAFPMLMIKEKSISNYSEALTLENLYRQYSNLVYRICMRYAKNREDSEELVQEVFVKINNSLGKFQGDSKPMTWIYRITVNHCLDYLRRRRRDQDLLVHYLDSMVERNLEDPSEHCLGRIVLGQILDKLRTVTRQVLFMYYAEGLSHEQIAAVLGVSRVAVTKRLAKFKGRRSGWERSSAPESMEELVESCAC